MNDREKPFKLNCFGFLGIVLLLGGIASGIVLYYSILDYLK
tara:strand:- start:191 stop:313 length:123 start_codon:yes stop_codon:yes gene_type:complete